MAQNYVLLDRVELNATASSVTFSNIPQTGYTDLKIVMSARDSGGGTANSNYISFNGSASSFTGKYLEGSGSGTGSGSLARFVGNNTEGGATANTFASVEIYIPNYAGSAYKSFSVDSVTENNGTTAYADLIAGLWSDTSAITSITVTPTGGSYVAGSTFSLYGIAAYGTTPTVAPKADGGNVIATDGTYWYHAFLSSGTFAPQVALSADVLVVAGGGGGSGGGSGGAGGAGGIFYATSQSLSVTGYTCTIGGGGGSDTSGTNSTFGALTAAVGGGGASGAGAGQNGGSGGGGYPGQAGGTSTQTSTGGTGYGNAGGAGGAFTSPYPSGGGGGAGSAGTAGSGSQSGAGGAGLNTWSTWLSPTALGVSGYIAGGGGGGANQAYGGTGGAGGSGGGGAGGTSGGTGTAGTVNTGSGGGGSSKQPSGAGTGAAGGSGLIIIRYPVAS